MIVRLLVISVALWLSVGPLAHGAPEPNTLEIDAKFPAGNIVVEKTVGDDVYLRQDMRDTSGHWFYWHFRVRGSQGRTLTFHFTKGNVIGSRGPAFSTDGGETWQWLSNKTVRPGSFSYVFDADARDVRFAFAFPYTGKNLRAFLKRHENSPFLKVESLGKTKKDRDVVSLRLGRVDGKATIRVALTCRHHACESMASYVLEGIMEAILSDTEYGAWLRENVEFFVVPFVDGDGVEDGDQGKNRMPHDHNRDYEGKSIYPQVQAIRERLPLWSQGRLRLALDLHCPYINESVIYFVGGPNEKVWSEVGKLSKIVESVQTGPLRFESKHNLPIGKGWNTKATAGNQKAFARWAAELEGVVLATTIETPYATVLGKAVTDQTARAFGQDLARALRRYLDSDSSQTRPSERLKERCGYESRNVGRRNISLDTRLLYPVLLVNVKDSPQIEMDMAKIGGHWYLPPYTDKGKNAEDVEVIYLHRLTFNNDGTGQILIEFHVGPFGGAHTGKFKYRLEEQSKRGVIVFTEGQVGNESAIALYHFEDDKLVIQDHEKPAKSRIGEKGWGQVKGIWSRKSEGK